METDKGVYHREVQGCASVRKKLDASCVQVITFFVAWCDVPKEHGDDERIASTARSFPSKEIPVFPTD